MSTPKNPIADFAPKLVEITELITHLAFYAGWPNAMSAATKVKELFRK